MVFHRVSHHYFSNSSSPHLQHKAMLHHKAMEAREKAIRIMKATRKTAPKTTQQAEEASKNAGFGPRFLYAYM